MADAWVFPYTDFGESHETLGRPILRASFTVGVPGHRAGFAVLIDTGGPASVIAPHVLAVFAAIVVLYAIGVVRQRRPIGGALLVATGGCSETGEWSDCCRYSVSLARREYRRSSCW